MNRKKLVWILMSISSFSVLPSVTFALDMIPAQSHYYYDMGGGSLWSTPPSSPDQSIVVGGGSNTHLGYSCNAFNPSVSMANSMNDIENSVEAMSDTVLQSATTAVGSFPMYILEKASPELYNLIQNSMTSATDTFNLSTKSCQDSLSDIRDGKSPYEDWFAVSDSQGWMNYADSAAEGQEVDVNAAQKTMVQNQSQYGVPWFHDKANSGGSIGDQVPIQALYDVTVAGYNILVDPMQQTRTLDDVSAPPSSNFLTTYWATPKDAGEWGQLVLGDITISSEKTDAANQTHAGVGLMPIMSSCPHVANYEKTCPVIIADNLWDLIKGTSSQTPDNLREVSADQLMISPQVIQALQNQTSEEQTISVNEISQEVALQNLTDEALDFRRVLIAGMGTTQVQNLDPAKKQVATSIKTLEQEIDELSYDVNKRKEMMSTSLVKILDHESLKAIDSQNQREEVPATTMSNGAVYTNNG